MPRGKQKNYWTEDELLILGSGLPTYQLAEMLPGKTREAIMSKRQLVYGRQYTLTRYSEDELKLIAELWPQHVPVEDIIKEIKERFGHKRSPGSLRQQVLKLGLHREMRKTMLVQKFGLGVLDLGETPDEIISKLHAAKMEEKARLEQVHSEEVERALDAMEGGIALGRDRKMMFQAAMMAGATLQQVGDRVGLTRERIRQVTDPNYKPSVNPVGRPRKWPKEALEQTPPPAPKKEPPTLKGKSRPSTYVKYNPDSGRYDYGIIIYNWDEGTQDMRKLGDELLYYEAADKAEKLTAGVGIETK